MNSEKEYGANSVIRQTVLFRDQTAEEIIDQPDRQSRQGNRQTDAQNDRPRGSANEGNNNFENQYSQRARAKRQADKLIREKRPREEADPI